MNRKKLLFLFIISFSTIFVLSAMDDSSSDEELSDRLKKSLQVSKKKKKKESAEQSVSLKDAYFSPGIKDVLLQFIDNEKKGMNGAFYRLTHCGIARKLIDQKDKKNIALDVVVDKDYASDYCQALRLLLRNEVPVSIPKPRHRYTNGYEVMHHKFIIFYKNHTNKKLIWTGSFNATGAANLNNWENVVILHDPEAIEKFESEFALLKQHTRPLNIKDCVSTKQASEISKRINEIP